MDRLKKIISNSLKLSIDGDKFNQEKFAEEFLLNYYFDKDTKRDKKWKVDESQSYFILFQKNFGVTNLQFKEFESLLRFYSKRIDGSNYLPFFYKKSEFKSILIELAYSTFGNIDPKSLKKSIKH
jgi:hypothetical protein